METLTIPEAKKVVDDLLDQQQLFDLLVLKLSKQITTELFLQELSYLENQSIESVLFCEVQS